MKFRLNITKWVDGNLKMIEEEFESLENALHFSKKHHGHIKVYDIDRKTIVHSEIVRPGENTAVTEETYA
jgi:hypothetical protein